ncbi:hypothetical protein WDU94_010895 [Cyamophila willieti]
MSGLLFNLYIGEVCENQGIDFWLYADDKRIGMTIKNLTDHTSLQNTLDLMYQWCQSNKLQLNIDKCNIITYHRKKNPSYYPYSINNTPLRRVEESKDLGVTLQSDLRFTTHYDNIKNKALKVLGFINRRSKDFKDPHTYKILYFALVRPILEYASQVWSPHYRVHIKNLEMVQRRFLRSFAFKSGIKQENKYNFDFKPVLEKCETTTLEVRRKVYMTLFISKKSLIIW